ncbi:21 kDa protein, partial [Trifolium medium]|nr:21 kDa protein [Trifolium medium]
AALTDDNTCLDGFAGPSMNGNAKAAIENKVVNVTQVTSNALALVNRFASIH